MSQGPSGQRAYDAVDDERPTSGVEVPCLKVLDRLAKAATEFPSCLRLCREAAVDQQLSQFQDPRAGVAE